MRYDSENGNAVRVCHNCIILLCMKILTQRKINDKG